MESWHWFVLGVLLFMAEILGAGGFLICAGLAAFVVAGLLLLPMADFAWQWQLLLFTVLALLFTVAYIILFRRFNEKTDSPALNDRAARLVGTRLTLKEALIDGQGAIMVGDVRWRVTADQDIAAGAHVKVVASEGMILRLQPCPLH